MQGDTHHVLVSLVVESLAEDSHDKEVDEEGDKEGQAGLGQEIHVGLLHCLLLGPVDCPRLGTVGDMGAMGSGEHPRPHSQDQLVPTKCPLRHPGTAVPVAVPWSHLDQGGMEEDVMGHNDGTDDAHGLEQLLSPAARAVGQENALQHLHLPRPHHHILGTGGKGYCELTPPHYSPVPVGTPRGGPLPVPCRERGVPRSPLHLVAEGQGHDGDEEAEESLQFAEP